MKEPVAVNEGMEPADTAAAEQRWPAITAIATSLILPATTARRTRHVRLARAWGVHAGSALMLAVTVLLLIAWSEAGAQLAPAVIAEEFANVVEDIVDEFEPHPSLVIIPVIGVALLVEASLVAIALVVMPWGAKDEPLRTSFASAVRRTWLHVSGVLPLVLFIASTGILLDASSTAWRRANPGPVWPDYPERPSSLSPLDPGNQQKMKEYDAAWKEYQRQVHEVQPTFDAWRSRQPWYVREWEVVPIWMGFFGALWLLISGLRAVGAPRPGNPPERPPLCDLCGYNLTTMPMDARCPECGQAVAASIGSNVRPGCPWSHRREVGRLRAWRKCAFEAVMNTRAFGRLLRTVGNDTDHRSFLGVHLPFILVIGMLGLYSLSTLETSAGGFPEDWVIILTISSVFGAACVMGTIGVVTGAAAIVGLVQSLKAGRNLLPAAMQMACYLAPYLTAWAVFGAATALVVFWLEDQYFFRAGEDLTGIYRDTLAFIMWFLPNLAWALWYIVLVVRGTVAMRYANR